jgi:hypothetical protein
MEAEKMTDKPLTYREKLERDIAGLRESIELCTLEFRNASTAEERKRVFEHLGWCQQELSKLKIDLAVLEFSLKDSN